ncbi:MAG TPA: hypothetical protein VNI52_07550 [Sphingobacteriaceae bacterium]|nr:hypothetical protein [Sphingobacteriaceae bacterium]
MNNNNMVKLITLLILLPFTNLKAQSGALKNSLGKPNTWTNAQLMQPANLALMINKPGAHKPLIFNIGVVDDIKGAKNVGAASDQTNLEKFKKALSIWPKNTSVVVYCGCCPFEKCPNIRPAFKLVKDMGFKNARLLNLPTNIKTDWIAKGYPMAVKK